MLEPVLAAEPEDVEALWVMATAEMDLADAAEDEAAANTLMMQARRRLGAAGAPDL